ncbi:PEP-utilizing enzyme [Arthrobacter bambusae]|uniref:PEP-utilizing enzyme n=1 Tax=Arthrobacter bambusae TaxID=1338426 RepID=UPI002782BB6B|nr:hypothetical protein [Arthrobacter bambusae]MDQ0210440.1 phosphoenolpyruvate synthase/pyruvate phosphate dikinase [Arthrobacter bambusae]MDQ0234889.1 phosphoenolpyruvate synthase/pyruvate phosphate dikinase [Arthrobacter bambusae]
MVYGFETRKRNIDEGPILQGFPVSPGRVTAPASVILTPVDFEKMMPDTILVCPTTIPAWTPLLAHAKGLVTDNRAGKACREACAVHVNRP